MIELNKVQTEQVTVLYDVYKKDVLTRAEINAVVKKGKIKNPSWLKTDKYKVDRGCYKLPLNNTEDNNKVDDKVLDDAPKKQEAAYIVSSLTGDIVPKKDKVFVPFGNYSDVKNIIKSGQFYPCFVTGLSGNGKTMAVTQACAEMKKELIRVMAEWSSN